MNLRSVDLNLLVALDAILSERHVTRAADRLGLSQPAMSNTLGRLRRIFKGELLVRTAAECSRHHVRKSCGKRSSRYCGKSKEPLKQAQASIPPVPAERSPSQSFRAFVEAPHERAHRKAPFNKLLGDHTAGATVSPGRLGHQNRLPWVARRSCSGLDVSITRREARLPLIAAPHG
jgi:hypothetical protein